MNEMSAFPLYGPGDAPGETRGALVAVPSVKLVHHFLAMVTIGFGEIVRLLLLNGGGLTGGPDGIVSIPRLEVGPLVFDSK